MVYWCKTTVEGLARNYPSRSNTLLQTFMLHIPFMQIPYHVVIHVLATNITRQIIFSHFTLYIHLRKITGPYRDTNSSTIDIWQHKMPINREHTCFVFLYFYFK